MMVKRKRFSTTTTKLFNLPLSNILERQSNPVAPRQNKGISNFCEWFVDLYDSDAIRLLRRQVRNTPVKPQLTIPGNPVLTPLTMSQIFLAFSITSSLVCNLGIGYWKTQHPTVSSELEIFKAKREFRHTKMMHREFI